MAEAEFIVGRSDNAVWASELIARRFGLPVLPEQELQRRIYETRAVEPSPALPSRWPFSFSPDGKMLRLTHRTPRPWAHVMANERGAATMVSNDGEMFSAFGNARQNGLSAFRFDSVTTVQPGQIVYLRDLEDGETDALGFAPFQRADATHEVVYEPGVATFMKARGGLTTEYAVFVPPDYPGDMRVLTCAIRERRHDDCGSRPFSISRSRRARTRASTRSATRRSTERFCSKIRRNDFVRGFAFAATSLQARGDGDDSHRDFSAGRAATC